MVSNKWNINAITQIVCCLEGLMILLMEDIMPYFTRNIKCTWFYLHIKSSKFLASWNFHHIITMHLVIGGGSFPSQIASLGKAKNLRIFVLFFLGYIKIHLKIQLLVNLPQPPCQYSQALDKTEHDMKLIYDTSQEVPEFQFTDRLSL